MNDDPLQPFSLSHLNEETSDLKFDDDPIEDVLSGITSASPADLLQIWNAGECNRPVAGALVPQLVESPRKLEAVNRFRELIPHLQESLEAVQGESWTSIQNKARYLLLIGRIYHRGRDFRNAETHYLAALETVLSIQPALDPITRKICLYHYYLYKFFHKPHALPESIGISRSRLKDMLGVTKPVDLDLRHEDNIDEINRCENRVRETEGGDKIMAPFHALNLNNLAIALANDGQLKRAVDLLKQALEIEESFHNHPTGCS